MTILFNTMMTATRMDGFADVTPKRVRKSRNPFQFLRAYKQFHQFRSMDVALLQDVGISRSDVERATLGDFLGQPRR